MRCKNAECKPFMRGFKRVGQRFKGEKNPPYTVRTYITARMRKASYDRVKRNLIFRCPRCGSHDYKMAAQIDVYKRGF